MWRWVGVLSELYHSGVWTDLEYMLRIVVAAVLGLAIGSERRNRNKSAGPRTHSILAVGAALIIIVSKYGFDDVSTYDAARIAAQVVSGIGFLCAGVIFVRRNLVSGLTTAAGLWTTGGVGLAAGAGMYVLAISTTVLVILIQFIMHKVTYLADEATEGFLRLTLKKKAGIMQSIEKFLEDEHVSVVATNINKTKGNEIILEFDVIFPPRYKKSELYAKLLEMDDVLSVSE